jgi:hypothetical protein
MDGLIVAQDRWDYIDLDSAFITNNFLLILVDVAAIIMARIIVDE